MQFLSKYHDILHRSRTNNLKTYIKPQKTPNSQSNLEKKEAGGITCLDIRLQYKATVIKQYGTGTKKTHRSMEQNREPRNKPTHLWSINL